MLNIKLIKNRNIYIYTNVNLIYDIKQTKKFIESGNGSLIEKGRKKERGCKYYGMVL